VGVLLPNCAHRKTLWRHLREGESQLSLEPDPSDAGVTTAMGRIRDFEPAEHLKGLPERHWKDYCRSDLIYLATLLSALDDAGIDLARTDMRRVGLYDGTARGNFAYWHERIAGKSRMSRRDLPRALPGMAVGLAAALLGVRGPTYTFAGACSAGAISIGQAAREIASGEVDVALASGHDAALLGPIYEMYRDAGLLSDEQRDARRAVRPYGGGSRNAFGEGAVTLVLESAAHARARGAAPIARLAGYGFGNTGQHPTHVDATGLRTAELILELLARERLDPRDIDFVIGHGNAVPASDASEVETMRRVFGDRVSEVPLLSTKPIYGHTLGASAALSIAAAAMMLDAQLIAPTINVDPARSAPGLRHGPRAEPRSYDAGIVVSLGMGGQNAAVLLRRAPSASPGRRAA
jgi:3-oxoacyl-[acyl-carrier-protein] synthase II